jgi:Protein of unknown function (DUF4232)
MHARGGWAGLVALVAVVVASAGLVGCSSPRHHGSATGTTVRATSSSSTSTTDATSSSTTGSTSTTGAPGSTTTAAGPPACPTRQLTASLGAGQGAAGHLITPLSLTNHGSTPCVVQGYPGVSLLDARGATIGTPATRATRPVTGLTLAPGAGAVTDLETQNQGISPGPCWAPSVSIKVFPPNQHDALTIPGVLQVCGNEFTATPMASS